MVSHKHKCIFIHIPKTGGSSVEMKLGLFEKLEWGVQDHRTIRAFQPVTLPIVLKFMFVRLMGMRRSPKGYVGKYILKDYLRLGKNSRLTQKAYNNYFKFTIVRNPWARVFSWYLAVMHDPRHGVEKKDFTTFLKENKDNWALKPQLYWIRDLNHEIGMDYIVRFEELQKGMTEVLEHLKIADTTLPHLLDRSQGKDPGQHKDYREAYNSAMIDIVAKRYKEEINIFNYRFE